MGSFLEKKKLTFEKSHDFWENGLRKLKTCLWKDDQTGLENSYEKISWVFSFLKKKSKRTMILRGKEVLFERIFMEKLVLNKKRILRKNSWVLFFKESLGSKNPMIFL